MKRELLNMLIDSFERSKGYHTDDIKREVSVSIIKRPDYISGDYKSKKTIDEAVLELSIEGLISFKWEKFEKGNLINKIVLEIDEAERSYSYLKRKPLKIQIKEVKDDLEGINENDDWAIRFKKSVLDKLNYKYQIDKKIPRDRESRINLINIINGVQEIEEMTERLFSIKFLRDSKLFEKRYRSKLVSILKDFNDEDLNNDELLEMVGVVKNTKDIFLKGNITYVLDKYKIDTSKSINGTSINSEDIAMMGKLRVNASKVITIENKAVYDVYKKFASSEELIIYIGGFFGKFTAIFLQKLKESSENLKFSHWGDIDLGGVLIYYHLEKILDEKLSPMFMDTETLLKNKNLAIEMDETYRMKIRNRIINYPNDMFVNLFKSMIELNLRLEQEAIIVNKEFWNKEI